MIGRTQVLEYYLIYVDSTRNIPGQPTSQMEHLYCRIHSKSYKSCAYKKRLVKTEDNVVATLVKLGV